MMLEEEQKAENNKNAGGGGGGGCDEQTPTSKGRLATQNARSSFNYPKTIVQKKDFIKTTGLRARYKVY